MKRVARVALAILTFCAVGFVFVGAPDAEAAPTVINTVADLQNIQNDLAGDYVLGGNIDASGFNFTPIVRSTQNDFSLDGILNGPFFTGTFDGAGHTISGLTINNSTDLYVSLFGVIGAGGVVKNVDLQSNSIYADAAFGGGSKGMAGGLAGLNYGTISNSFASGSVSNAGSNAGGLVAVNWGTIANSYATGLVNSAGVGGYVGGLVGINNATITDSHADASVSAGIFGGVGGLVGLNGDGGPRGTISRSYSTGAVSTGDQGRAGGLAAWNNYIVSDSYAQGAVSGGLFSQVAGLIGINNYGISSVYATGAVSGRFVAGLVWNNGGPITNGYWDIQTTGQSFSSNGGIGLTTAQLQSGALPSGFDPSIWTAAPGQYPRLKWQVVDEFLSFPLRGLTSETAVINSVMDHSVPIDTAGVHFYDDAGTTDVITAFTGEQGLKNCGVPHCFSPVGGNGLAGYKQSSGLAFFVNGNYSGGLYLFYQGHSGYDFSAAVGTEILAPADGVAFIPDADPIVSKNAVGAITRFNILAVDHLNGYVTWYMHLGDNNSDFRRIKCPPDAAEALIQPNQFIPVTRGCRIGFVGYKGLNGPKDAHLHFEVRRGVTTDPVSKVRTCARPTCFPVDPYGWEPLSNAPVQSDPYSIYPNGARLWLE